MAIITPLTDDYVIQVVRMTNPSLPVPINNETVKVSKVTVDATRVETWVEGTNVGTTDHSDTWVGEIPITTQKLNLGVIFQGLGGLVRLTKDVPSTVGELIAVLNEYFGVDIPQDELTITQITPDKVGRHITFSATPNSRSYYGSAEVYLRPPFIDFDSIPVDVLEIIPVLPVSDWVVLNGVCPNLSRASHSPVPRQLANLLLDISGMDYTNGERLPLPKILDEAIRLYAFNLCGVVLGPEGQYVVGEIVKGEHYQVYQINGGVATEDFINIYFKE